MGKRFTKNPTKGMITTFVLVEILPLESKSKFRSSGRRPRHLVEPHAVDVLGVRAVLPSHGRPTRSGRWGSVHMQIVEIWRRVKA